MIGHTRKTFFVHQIVRVFWFVLMIYFPWNWTKIHPLTFVQACWAGVCMWLVFWLFADLETARKRREYSKSFEGPGPKLF